MLQSSECRKCERVLDLMEAWIDGDLDPLTAEEIHRHVDGCPECRAESQLAGEVHATLQSFPVLEPPPALIAAVKLVTSESISLQTGVEFQGPPLRRPLAAAMALAALVLLVALIRPERQAPPPLRSVAEVERVTTETRMALAYLSVVARRAETRATARIVDDRSGVARLDSVSSSLKRALGPNMNAHRQPEKEGSL